MNILFLSGHYPPKSKGGGEISTHLLAKELVGIGHSIHVATEATQGQNGLLDSVHIVRRPFGLIGKPLFERIAAARSAIAIRKAIDLDEFDVFHAHDFRSALVLAELMRANVIPKHKCVVTIRDYAAISGDTNFITRDGNVPENPFSWRVAWESYRVHEVPFPKNIGRFFQYVFNTRYRLWAFSQFRNRVYISHAQRKRIAKHLPAIKSERVIYNPVANEYLKKPLVPEVPNVALFVGRTEEYKGLRLLLESWQVIAQQVPSAELYVLGTGAQLQEYKALVQKLEIEKKVHFSQHVSYDEMMDWYNRASIVVAPNIWFEPFGRAVVEAMARGRVVVASDAGGPGELISSKLNGYIVERNSVSDLTATLLEVLTAQPLDRSRVGRAARDFVEKELTSEKIGAAYNEFYLHIRSQAVKN